MRRSSSSTCLTVSARSASVAPSYGTVSKPWHMSTAMMSAPSWARRSACERPWPRAAPVMKATLPSILPMGDTSLCLVRTRRWSDVVGQQVLGEPVPGSSGRGVELGLVVDVEVAAGDEYQLLRVQSGLVGLRSQLPVGQPVHRRHD